MPAIHFFNEGIRYKIPHPRKTASWIRHAISSEGFKLHELNFVFCSDPYLRSMNVSYLRHQTYTDIITFDTSQEPGLLEGDIFISIHRVRENAAIFEALFDTELHRVIIHGVLHLMGYSDKTPRKKAIMRKKEDAYLSLRK
ncbi:MAG TPA: rRNA maturation RNase YbeY [Chryseolinea sp.]|nr:rRNA maturation RNase YbeY [Chryseolinea sp.]